MQTFRDQCEERYFSEFTDINAIKELEKYKLTSSSMILVLVVCIGGIFVSIYLNSILLITFSSFGAIWIWGQMNERSGYLNGHKDGYFEGYKIAHNEPGKNKDNLNTKSS